MKKKLTMCWENIEGENDDFSFLYKLLQKFSCNRFLAFQQVGGGAFKDEISTVFTTVGTKVDNPVGKLYHFGIEKNEAFV